MRSYGLGIIGCGGFGLFALQHFAQVEGVRLIAMAGTHRPQAIACARRFGIPDPVEVEALVAMPEVDIVYIATPPFLHYPQAKLALEAGKHVIVEKPLATRVEHAEALIALARAQNCLLVTNLMQRYNPLFDQIQRVIAERPLGALLHAYFENYATDEGLPPDHWFWDHEKSGGIFIEHGVHFFDLFEGWLGQGTVMSAQRSLRPNSGVEEQVSCTVCYPHGVLVNFYHGFHQVGRMDRQEMRFVFELGDITLYEWIPTRVRIEAVVDEAQTRQLCEIFPNALLDISAVYSGKERQARSRFVERDLYQRIVMRAGLEDQKMHLYGRLLRAMLTDQLAYLENPAHHRKITELNGLNSLRIAAEATLIAKTATL